MRTSLCSSENVARVVFYVSPSSVFILLIFIRIIHFAGLKFIFKLSCLAYIEERIQQSQVVGDLSVGTLLTTFQCLF